MAVNNWTARESRRPVQGCNGTTRGSSCPGSNSTATSTDGSWPA